MDEARSGLGIRSAIVFCLTKAFACRESRHDISFWMQWPYHKPQRLVVDTTSSNPDAAKSLLIPYGSFQKMQAPLFVEKH